MTEESTEPHGEPVPPAPEAQPFPPAPAAQPFPPAPADQLAAPPPPPPGWPTAYASSQPPARNHWLKFAAVLVAGIIVAVGAVGVYAAMSGGGGNSPSSVQNTSPTASSATSTSSSGNASLVSGDCMSAADIYEAVRPSVVEIDVQGTTNNGRFGSQNFSATGTGIVLDTNGNILTNDHVIADATDVRVLFDDGASISATVVGGDPGNDVAVIKVDPSAHALKTATLGDSSTLRIGDPVLALGNPFNLEASLTQGIVSGLNRDYSEGNTTRPIHGLIQTDAAVNPGNSGGPLIDCHGQVIGINTLLDNPTGESVNVGVAFAVSINTAKAELSTLEASQTVGHAWLGIEGLPVTSTLKQDLNLTVDNGVYVTFVSSGGPADSAGIKGAFASQSDADNATAPQSGGDVIVSADGQNLTSVEQLAQYLDQNKKPGDTVQLGIVRDGQSITITATLGNFPTA